MSVSLERPRCPQCCAELNEVVEIVTAPARVFVWDGARFRVRDLRDRGTDEEVGRYQCARCQMALDRVRLAWFDRQPKEEDEDE